MPSSKTNLKALAAALAAVFLIVGPAVGKNREETLPPEKLMSRGAPLDRTQIGNFAGNTWEGADPAIEKKALDRLVRFVPPLRNSRGDRWPVVNWGNPPAMPELRAAFIERGLSPMFNAVAGVNGARSLVPAMKQFQDAGVPLVLLPQGWVQRAFLSRPNTGTGCNHLPPAPAETHGDPEGRYRTCPAWMYDNPALKAGAESAVEVCRVLREAGIEPASIWIDYESGVYLRNQGEKEPNVRIAMEAALQCPRCLERFGRDALDTLEEYQAVADAARAYSTRVAFSDPVHSVFPDVPVGNYYAYPVRRLPRTDGLYPAYGWEGSGMKVAQPRCYFTTGWGGAGTDQRKGDWNVFSYCVGRFSSCARVLKEDEIMVPWVGYLFSHAPSIKKAQRKGAIASAQGYREMAIHTLLRGAETIALFNPFDITDDFDEAFSYLDRYEQGPYIVNAAPVLSAFDAVLAHSDLLRSGQPLNLEFDGEYNALDERAVVWSGVGNKEKALIRTVSFAEPTKKAIQVFGKAVELPFERAGRFFHVYPDGRVEPLAEEAD